MSTLINDQIAESLFERLEELEPAMNIHEYADRQSEVLRLLASGSFEEAAEAVLTAESKYLGLVTDIQADSGLQTDVY